MKCALSARPTAPPVSLTPLHLSSCALHPRMQQRPASVPSGWHASCAAALAALARFASIMACAASRCDTLAVAGESSQAACSSAHCRSSQRSRHSRPLRPGRCVDTSGHALSLTSRPLLDNRGTSACSRTSPPLDPSHEIGGAEKPRSLNSLRARGQWIWSTVQGGGGRTRSWRHSVSGGGWLAQPSMPSQ
eukprot:4712542-Prymnesium_polylepis.2